MDSGNIDIQQVVGFINWDKLPYALLLIAVAFVVLRVVAGTFNGLGERFTDRRLQIKKAEAMTRFLVYLVAAAGVTSTALRLDSQAMLALAGTVGVAVGFAFKDLLASLMSGIILLFDQPFQVGDRVAFGSYYGEVTEIGLRSVRLVTLDDNLVTIPNNAFLNSAVASANAGALDCMCVLDFHIAAADDFELASRLVSEATATSGFLLTTKPIVILVSDEFLGERFVTRIRSKAYVFDCRYEKAYASDITRRVKKAFALHGVRTPDQQYRDLDLNGGRESATGGQHPEVR
jgi:small conductance mechanosensitive channel